jgi:hypothetical protein
MNATNATVDIEIRRTGVMHVSEVISRLLPQYVESSNSEQTMFGDNDPRKYLCQEPTYKPSHTTYT